LPLNRLKYTINKRLASGYYGHNHNLIHVLESCVEPADEFYASTVNQNYYARVF
jgi:hypothetical protein